jgi:hypothetical protein
VKTSAVSEIIAHLKAIKEEENLSCQEIFEMVEENGDSVSLATIKRIFASGSEEQRFRYEDTVAPVARVLFGSKRPAEELSPDKVTGLQEAIIIRQKMSEEANRQLAEKDRHIRRLGEERDLYRSRSYYFKRMTFVLAAVLIILFIVDIILPGAGWLSIDLK